MTGPLKILLLEDNPEDAEIVQRLLRKADPAYQFNLAIDKKTYLEALENFQPDIILSDNYLLQFNATEALKIIQERALLIPFILVTGTVSDEFAASIIKLGAADYVLKDRLTRLPVAIEAAVKQRQVQREKKEAIEDLIRSEEKYRTLFAKSPLPNWIYDFETLRFLEVNDAAIRHYGYTLEEFLGMTIKDIRPAEDREELLVDLQKIDFEPDVRRGRWTHVKKSGERIIVETTAHSIVSGGRKARMVIVHDITEQVRIAQEREFASNNLSALINNTDDLMWSVDKNFRLITSNDSFNRVVTAISGKPVQEGDNILSDQFTEEQLSRYREFYTRAFSGEAFTIIERFDSPIRFWSEISFHPIRQGDLVIGTACFSRDITGRKKAEEEMRSMEKELLNQKIQAQKKVTRAVIKTQEKERNYIGRELHDNVNQILASAKMYLNMSENKDMALKEMIKFSSGLIDSCIHEIRALTSAYVAPLKDVNLRESVQQLLDKVRESSTIQTTLQYESETEIVNDELKLNLYRIFQEQINNILKHAGAKNIDITIATDNNYITILVVDDGKGFDPEKKRNGIGISNMINRIESFNGEMTIESSPGKGCRTRIRVPYCPQ